MLRKEVNRKAYTADTAEKSWKGRGSESSEGSEGILKYEVFPLENTEHTSHQFNEQITSRLEYAERIANQLASQLAEKTGELDRLREYITQLEEGEKGLVQELTQQLAMKDEEISRIAALYAKKEAENRRMASQLESHIGMQRQHAEKIKELLLKKEEETARLVEGLRKQLEAKNSDVSSLRGSLLELEKSQSLSLQSLQSTPAHLQQTQAMRQEMEGKNSEVRQIEKALIEEQRLNRSIQARLKEQIVQTLNQMEELKSLLMEKEEVVMELESAFKEQLAAKDDEISRLKGAAYARTKGKLQGKGEQPTKQDSDENAGLIARLRQELELKTEEVEALQRELSETGDSKVSPTTGESGLLQLQQLHEQLTEKDSAVKKLERALAEEQRMGKSLQARLKEQLSQAQAQTEELKAFLIEKEKLVQNLESAFEKRLAAKEEELRHFKGVVHAKPETRLHRQLDGLKSELYIKEETARMMAEELAKLKEQSALLLKRLDERQRIFFESEKAYEELIARLRQQHDARIKQLVQESSQKTAALKIALEEERAEMQRTTAVMKEKEKQIEETLQAFATTSQQLFKLQGAGVVGESAGLNISELVEKEKQLQEKEKYLESKEGELKQLLASTEAKIAELNGKEAAMERKEQLLLSEQEALNKELEVLTSAGIEISRSRQYLQQKLASIGFEQPAQQPQQQITTPVETAEFVEEQQQPYKPQTTQRITRQQMPSAQELGLGGGAGGVQDAQEEEGSDAPKFTGITSEAGAAVGEVKEALEEGEDFAPSVETSIKQAPAATVSATRKVKAVTIPKIKTAAAAKGRKLTKKQKILAKVAVKKQPLRQQPKQRLKPLWLPKKAFAAAKEAQKGKGLGLPEELRGKEGQELFTELGGYSEIDEIKSVVEVGLQHGDSIEQIRQSLITSGYSRQNIERVLSSVKK